MDSVDLEVMRATVAWLQAGHGATIGTVTRTWGSAPRPVGAMLAIRDDGHVMGSVSGGCVEDDLIEKVKAHKLAAEKPEVTTYGITNEEANRWGLPCGGTLQLVLEPVTSDSRLKELLDIIERHELVARVLDMETGAVRLEPGCCAARRSSSANRLSGPSAAAARCMPCRSRWASGSRIARSRSRRASNSR